MTCVFSWSPLSVELRAPVPCRSNLRKLYNVFSRKPRFFSKLDFLGEHDKRFDPGARKKYSHKYFFLASPQSGRSRPPKLPGLAFGFKLRAIMAESLALAMLGLFAQS